MQRSYVLMQLIHNGQAAWQVRQEIAPELCRKMAKEELEAIGQGAANVLEGVIRTSAELSHMAAVSAKKGGRDAKHTKNQNHIRSAN